jgi:hypothetical protein
LALPSACPHQPSQGTNPGDQPQDPFLTGPHAPQPHLFMPPPTGNTGASASLPFLFPEIEEGMLLAIAQHAIKPGTLFKLNTCIKEKPSATTLDFENGSLIHREWEPTIKEYSSFVSLYSFSTSQFSRCQSQALAISLPSVKWSSRATSICAHYMTFTSITSGQLSSTTISHSMRNGSLKWPKGTTPGGMK